MGSEITTATGKVEESSKIQLLVADRNRHIRDLLRRELQTEGYAVFCAKDAWEVLEWLEQHGPPHLVILDLDLPFAAEINLLEHLSLHWPRLPILLYAFPPAPRRPATAKVAFLEKSDDPAPLKAAISALLKS